jgi:hypothetical protein
MGFNLINKSLWRVSEITGIKGIIVPRALKSLMDRMNRKQGGLLI